jgi:triphosphoribosyl-dephospho-CoA synthase
MHLGVARRSALVASWRTDQDIARTLAHLSVRSLHAELALYPKPGLVSLRDNGAHTDMNAATFLRSLFSLRHYFADIALAGMRAAPMTELRRLGIHAETRMLRATGDVNTHRGAIFALGMLGAAAGRAWSQGGEKSDDALRAALTMHWRRGLLAVPAPAAGTASHGRQMAARHGVAGARGEAIDGFPSVFDIALPALREALARGAGVECARVHAFFSLLAGVVDTNVLYRGGVEALQWLQREATEFIAGGSVFADGWFARAEGLHRRCSRDGISPGGCADLLAAACFVHAWQATPK